MEALALLPEGRLLVGGEFETFNGTDQCALVLLSAEGTLDARFYAELDYDFGGPPLVTAIAVQEDGKIIVGGLISSVGVVQRSGIARLNSDGTPDLQFDPGDGLEEFGEITSIALQEDGKILIGGFFESVDAVPRRGIARLNANGQLDGSFDPGKGIDGDTEVAVVTVDSSARILIGGDFSTYNGEIRHGMARLNSNGSIDKAFSPPLAAGSEVKSIVFLPGGKMLIGGVFETTGGTARRNLALLNEDGTIDVSFSSQWANVNHDETSVESVIVDSAGRIVVAGVFPAGSETRGMLRFSPEGEMDEAFVVVIEDDSGEPPEVEALLENESGDLLFVGNFTSINNNERGRIARLTDSTEAIQPKLYNPAFRDGTFTVQLESSPEMAYDLEYLNAIPSPSWSLADSRNGTGEELTLTDTNAVSGHRYYRVRMNNP